MGDFPRTDFTTEVACKGCGEPLYIEADLLCPDGHECQDCIELANEEDYQPDGFRSDAEADADALASCGWGTDEDYGSY